jgi:2Fe-2S ferredoxin
MPIITINPTGKTVEAAEGSRLLDVLLSNGETIQRKCEDKAECDSCHIYIVVGRKGVSKIQRAENARLDSIVGVSSNSRLACQVILGSENITVEMPGV